MLDFVLNAAKLPDRSFVRLLLLVSLAWSMAQVGVYISPKNVSRITSESIRIANIDTKSDKLVLYALDSFGNPRQVSPKDDEISLDIGAFRASFRKKEAHGYWNGTKTKYVYGSPVLSQEKNLIGFIYCEFGAEPQAKQLEIIENYTHFYSILVMLS